MKNFLRIFLSGLAVTLAGACVSVPEGVEPVTGFDSERYLGTWYEIARLDHSFERGMDNVTATYARREDGGISVLNRGYKTKAAEWDDAEGKAYFVDGEDIAHLKVSFFGPFYGSYIVFKLDQNNYHYAYIAGNSRKYLWLLSRTPEISETRREDFIRSAAELGFETDNLIWVDQSRNAPAKAGQ